MSLTEWIQFEVYNFMAFQSFTKKRPCVYVIGKSASFFEVGCASSLWQVEISGNCGKGDLMRVT